MSSVSCSICWEIVTSTCAASYLSCGHVYHHDCLDKWLKTSRTCPECRSAVTNTKRIYLNLVPDPGTELLNSELARKTKEFEFLSTDNEILYAIIKQLEEKMSAKDEELFLCTKRNDEFKSSAISIQHQNEKLKLELEMQEKQQIYLTNEVADLKNQLETSLSNNIEITNSTVALKEYYREQIKQITDLHSEILNLTERLDQFRCMFVAADNKLQIQAQENQVIKSERDSLLTRNTHLYQRMYSLKMQLDKKLLRQIKMKYKDRPLSSRRSQEMNTLNRVSQYHLKKKRKKLQHQVKSSENLKIRLIKSKLSWTCVKS